MKAYKCDRCGKLFEKYEHQGTSKFFNISTNPCMSGHCLDLCPNCNAELQEWVTNDKEQVDCKYTDEEIAKSFIEDVEAVKDLLPPVKPQETKTGQFAKWVATEIFDDQWENNKYSFAEIACRKLAKLGIVRAKGDDWKCAFLV